MGRAVITGLTDTFGALLPAVEPPRLPHEVALDSVSIMPAGIGGFVGFSDAPAGEIHAIRVKAVARVRVGTTDTGGLPAAVADVTAAVVAGDRALQRANGLLEAELEGVGPETATDRDGEERYTRDVRFRVLYEHLQLPVDGQELIEKIPTTIEVAADGGRGLTPAVAQAGTSSPSDARSQAGPATAGTRQVKARSTVTTMSIGMSDVEVIDDARATREGPSAWSFDAASQRFRQTSAIWGGVRTLSVNKPATYLVLRAAEGRGPFADVRFDTYAGSDGSGGIGVVFRWRDPDNFYFALLQRDLNFRLLGRKVGGSFASLRPPVAQRGASFTAGVTHRITVTALGSRLSVAVDDEPPLVGVDDSLPEPGRVGCMCHHDGRAFFSFGDLREL